MSEVTVIGLGKMGSAYARALRKNGFAVTVWKSQRSKRGAPGGSGRGAGAKK